MNRGDNETSYANNSSCQKLAVMKSRRVIEYSLRNQMEEFPKCFRMADLACSTGPNALLAISYVVHIIEKLCQERCHQIPEFELFLNDLPHNDFNNLFKLLTNFHEKRRDGRCFVSGLPGSFYNRLFPSDSLHFVSPFTALHWLSRVPEGLDNNKGNIYHAPSSPLDVFEAYLKQFESDFSNFLSLRAEEIKHGGRMVLAFPRRTVPNPTRKDDTEFFSLLAKELVEMSTEGILEEAKVDAFNMPVYQAYKEEVEIIIQREASFKLDKLEMFEVNWDGTRDINDEDNDQDSCKSYCDLDIDDSIKIVKNTIRAFMEPLLALHFGTSFMDEIFARYEKCVSRRVGKSKLTLCYILLALTRK